MCSIFTGNHDIIRRVTAVLLVSRVSSPRNQLPQAVSGRGSPQFQTDAQPEKFGEEVISRFPFCLLVMGSVSIP